MTPTHKLLLKWLIAVMVFGAGIWLCCASPGQGSGAIDQVRGAKRSYAKARALSALALPSMSAPVKLGTNVYWFAATARDGAGQVSDFSDEVSITNTLRQRWATLDWNPVEWKLPITNYSLYVGRESRNYTTNFNAGTNLALTVELWPKLTNLVVVVSFYDGRVLSITNPAKAIELFTNATISSWRF